MRCPKCGFEQPTGPECVQCGVIFDKLRDAGQRAVPRPVVKEEEEPVLERPIRPVLKWVRTAAGGVAVFLGSTLFVVGGDYVFAPHQVLLLMLYGCVGLFWVFSAVLGIEVRLKQFAVEMVVFVAATVLLKLLLPEAFDVGRLSNRQGGPQYGETAVPESPQEFVGRVVAAVEQVRDVLEAGAGGEDAAAWSRQVGEAKRLYRRLNRAGREECEGIYKGMVALEEKVGAALGAGDRDVRDAAFEALEELEKRLAARSSGTKKAESK